MLVQSCQAHMACQGGKKCSVQTVFAWQERGRRPDLRRLVTREREKVLIFISMTSTPAAILAVFLLITPSLLLGNHIPLPPPPPAPQGAGEACVSSEFVIILLIDGLELHLYTTSAQCSTQGAHSPRKLAVPPVMPRIGPSHSSWKVR